MNQAYGTDPTGLRLRRTTMYDTHYISQTRTAKPMTGIAGTAPCCFHSSVVHKSERHINLVNKVPSWYLVALPHSRVQFYPKIVTILLRI